MILSSTFGDVSGVCANANRKKELDIGESRKRTLLSLTADLNITD